MLGATLESILSCRDLISGVQYAMLLHFYVLNKGRPCLLITFRFSYYMMKTDMYVCFILADLLSRASRHAFMLLIRVIC